MDMTRIAALRKQMDSPHSPHVVDVLRELMDALLSPGKAGKGPTQPEMGARSPDLSGGMAGGIG